MNIEEAIRQRRSIRKYAKHMPKEVDIEKIIEAAIWAPSGLNNQPWKFMILRGDRKNGLAEFTKYADIIKQAPLAICVFLDNSVTYNREKDIMSLGASIQNMLLQAYEMGLGTCWLGEILNRKTEVHQFLGSSPDYELMAVVTLGVAGKEITEACRRNLNSFILD